MLSEFECFERAVQRYAHSRGGPACRLLRAEPLLGGISARMTLLEIEDAAGATERLILRRPPAQAEAEFGLLKIVRAAGIPAPEPLALDSSKDLFPTPYLLTRYLEGAPDFAPVDREAFARQSAEQLACIHRVDGAQADLAFLTTVEDQFSAMLARPAAEPALDPGGRIRAALQDHPLAPAGEASLLHGDYWPGNWLWQAGQLVGVVDWEDTMRGSAAADLAMTRLDLWWMVGPDTAEAFTRNYQSASGREVDDLPVWDLYAALRLARMMGADLPGWAAFFKPFGRDDITPESIRAHFETFVAQALAKLEAAR